MPRTDRKLSAAARTSIGRAETLLRHPIRRAGLPAAIGELKAALQRLKSAARHDSEPLKVQLIATIAQAQLELQRDQPTRGIDDVIEQLELALKSCYEDGSKVTGEDRSRVRLLIAFAYDLRPMGIRRENISVVVVQTDSLDLNQDSYLWWLSRVLRAKSYRDRGASDSTQFDLDAALRWLKDTIRALGKRGSKELLAEAHLEMARTLLSTRASDDHGDSLQAAERHLGKALAFFTAEQHPLRWGESTIALGNVHLRRYATGKSALRAFKKAVRCFESVRASELGPVGVSLTARADLEIAWLYSRPGPFKSDERTFTACESAIANLQRGDDVEAALKALSSYAVLLFSRRLWARAAEVMRAALTACETLMEASALLSARRDAVRPLSELASSLAYCEVELGQLDRAFLSLERGRARLLSETLQLDDSSAADAKNAQPPALSRIIRQIRKLEATQYGGMSDSDQNARHKRLRQRLHQLRSQDRDRLDELPASRRIADLAPSQPGQALIACLLTLHGGAIFILRHGESAISPQNVIRIAELSTERIDRYLTEDGMLSKAWFDAYSERYTSQIHYSRWMAAIDRMCLALGDTFVKTLSRRLKALAVRSITLIPSGGLQFLPLAACASGNDGHCLLDEFSIAMAPSAFAAAICARRTQSRSVSPGAYFIAGAGRYQDAPDLPYARSEVECLGQLLDVSTFLDQRLSKTAFRKWAPRSSIIHLACHGTGWFDGGSLFRFSWVPQPVLRFTKEGLTFADILALRLDETMLVTLSACDSGAVDRTLAWDELEGLPHIFLQAGAANVLSTLWAVNDLSTWLLMQRFYSNLTRDRQSPAQALRGAQLWLRDANRQTLCEALEPDAATVAATSGSAYAALMEGGERGDRPFRHPVYWAPFIITGA